MDIPLFLDKYCGLTAINNSGFSNSPPTPSAAWIAHRHSTFPFTEQESSNICLKASLVVAAAFRNLPHPHPCGPDTCSEGSLNRKAMDRAVCCTSKAPHTLPFFACCAMQGCYTLLMLLHRVRACLETGRLSSCYHLLNKPEPATEISDAERLVEELRHGVEFIAKSLKSDVIFEGVGGMGREIESAYLAAFADYPEIHIS